MSAYFDVYAWSEGNVLCFTFSLSFLLIMSLLSCREGHRLVTRSSQVHEKLEEEKEAREGEDEERRKE
jgi:hypothetical protein